MKLRLAQAALLAAALAPAAPAARAAAAQATVQEEDGLRIVRAQLDEPVRAYRAALAEERPPLRGFRAPILAHAGEARPLLAPGPDAPEGLRAAAAIVQQRLARDGLCATLVAAIDALGAEEIARAGDPARELAATGLPVDLLAHFHVEGWGKPLDPAACARRVAERLAAVADGAARDELARELAAAELAFAPSGFRAATESGEEPIDTLRLQLSRGDYWLGEGDGGNLDLARQLVRALPEARFLASIEAGHLEAFRAVARGWPLDGRLTVVVEELPIAQWAQDNGKAGHARAADGTTVVATLVPRYASRGEDGSTLVPGETFLADGLAAAGHAVIQSPLLFQGGNLLVAFDPRRSERVLLAGEAEVYRNVALGLTREQALEALRLELGADRALVLPAASFHIDAEVSLRTHAGELLAFVNDERAAVPIVLGCGVDALERAGRIEAEAAAGARAGLERADWRAVVGLLGGVLIQNAAAPGRYAESFVELFSTGAVDPGIGNLQSFLLALDRATAWGIRPEEIQDRHAQAYLRSLERTEHDRAALHALLEQNGWRLVRVPSLPDGARSMNYVNALHERAKSLVPAYGGLYEALDRAALDAYRAALGPAVELVPIQSAESQRRNGAVHCSVAAYPAP